MEKAEFSEEDLTTWNINKKERSWIISQDGEIKGGINHRAILKKYFSKEWDELRNDHKDDSEIEMILENRHLNLGMIYTGELTDIYVITQKLEKTEKKLINKFIKSFLINHNNFKNENITIQIKNGITEKYKINQIINDWTFPNR